MPVRCRLFIFALALAIPACASGGPEIAEVGGTVLWHQKPLANVEIQFYPANGPRSTDVTDEQGRYALAFDDGQPGAVVGPHRVVLIASAPTRRGGKGKERVPGADSRNKTAPHAVIDSRYERIATTPLSREVASGSQTINFDLP
jgi:hypothetical protein